jgi:peptide/nickel transport system permease protein
MRRAELIKNKAWWWILFLLVLALGRDILANGRPLYCKIQGETYYPGLRSIWADEARPYKVAVLDSLIQNPVAWKTYPYESAVFAPIPWSPGEWLARPAANLLPPGSQHPELPARFVHYLGTDHQGRDVCAGLISGARIALLTGLLAMVMSMSIGLLLGSAAGYFGDDRLYASRGSIITTLFGVLALPLVLIPIQTHRIVFPDGFSWLFLPAFILVLILLAWLINQIPVFKKNVLVPADLITMRLAELFSSIPILILIIAVAAMLKRQSTWVLIGMIGLLGWAGVARFIRAELLRVRSLDYIAAARVLGFSDFRILVRHALPNALKPIWVLFALGVGSAILLEAALSFLGFGGAEFQGISWGSLLQSIVRNREAWWLAIPPGLAIGITVLSLNYLGERMGKQS